MTSVDVDLLDRLPREEPVRTWDSPARVIVPVAQYHSFAGGISPDHILAIDLHTQTLKGAECMVRVGLSPTDFHAFTLRRKGTLMTDDSRLSDYVAADEGQDERLRESLAAWTSCSEGGHVRQHIISEAVRHIDSLDASDPEHAHGKLDEWLLVFAPTEVRKSAARLMGRCDWWAGA